jgi:nucleotide-binding universal stress UspA family protein
VKRMLLAVDRGAPAWEAARLAVHLAPLLRADVTVLTVLLPEPQEMGAKDQRKREYEADRALVDDVSAEIVAGGGQAHGEVRSAGPGRVHEEILAAARRDATDLIVMGSRARSQLAGMLLGSVSQKVAVAAECPVVVVPAGGMATVTPRRIVLVIDATGERRIPVAVTAELAHSLKASVEVACVSGTVEWPAGVKRKEKNPDAKAVAAAVASLKKAGIDAGGHVVPNKRGLAQEIAREAVATSADLIVIGTQAQSWVSEDLSAGVAASVARRTHRAVVVTPRPRPRKPRG